MTGKISLLVPTSTAPQLWGHGAVSNIFCIIPAGDITFPVTAVNNTFLGGIIEIMFH